MLKSQQRVRNLGSADEYFVENVNKDIRRFIRKYTTNCVLVFPPVSSFHRFLIHQTCESFCQEYDLCTFSIGQGSYRRTVVCFRSQVIDPSKLSNNQASSTSHEIRYQKPIENWRSTNDSGSTRFKSSNGRTIESRMGIGNNAMDNPNYKLNSSDPEQPHSLGNRNEIPSTSQPSSSCQSSLTIHRSATSAVSSSESPPRVNENEIAQSTVREKNESAAGSVTRNSDSAGDQPSRVQIARRERRPDRAVYVPRARRSQTTPPTSTTTMTTNTATTAMATATSTAAVMNTTNIGTSSSSSSTHRKSNSIVVSTANVIGAASGSTTSLGKLEENTRRKSKTINNNSPTIASGPSTSSNGSGGRVKERHRISLDKLKSNHGHSKDSNLKIISSKHQDCDRPQRIHPSEEYHHQQQYQQYQQYEQYQLQQLTKEEAEYLELKGSEVVVTTNEMNTTKKRKSLKELPPISANTPNGVDDKAKLQTKLKHPVPKVTQMFIEDVASSGHKVRHSSSRTKCDIDQQEFLRASKEINRSNRRIIKQTFVSDVLEIPDKIEPASEVYGLISNSNGMSPRRAAFDSTTEDEEDDWETKYDESGDCLDPKILEELESAVGKVKITTPKTDYSAFLTNQAILNHEEFPHVLEVSNFPVEFKNQDLLMVFSQYKESGFDIKWVDDTHALAVFSSSHIAAEVLTMGHPFVVLKPLAEATLESRVKAKKCAGSLQPYRQRPETCAALARRLVTGALGVRLETAAAERENEKRVLREAKERKLLAAKQRDEAWES